MIPTYLVNVGLLAWIGAVWVGCGYGFARALLPSRGRYEAVLLAPVLGVCLLGMLGMLELAVLLVPLRPWLNAGSLLVASSILAYLVARKNRPTAGLTAWQLAWLCLVPVVALLAFGGLFRSQGFHLLVGAQDQIQYCDNARHLLEAMHTGSEADVPVPRQDHLVSDFSTRYLAYLKEYRRGAEITLATTTALSGLTPEKAFPLTVGGGLLTLGLALAYLGRSLLRLRLAACVALQVLLLGANHLTLLHYQGSLAQFLGLPMVLLALPVTLRALRSFSRTCVLSGLLCGGLLSFYPEPAAVVFVLPLGLYVAWRFWASRHRGRLALRLAAVALVVVVVSPLAVRAAWENVVKNLEGVHAGLRPPADAPVPERPTSLTRAACWAQTGTVLGIFTYFDNTPINVRLSQSYATPAWRGCAACVLLWGLGIAGFVRHRRPTARLFGLVLCCWAVGAFVFTHTQDYLRYFRDVQYSMPFALLGLVLLARMPTRPPSLGWVARWGLVWPVRLALVLLVAVNVYTVYRTARYTVKRNAFTDPTLFRFDDTAPEWVALRRQLGESGDAPVLISGYKDTIRPHLLSIGTRAPHFLGQSIATFWPLPKLHDSNPAERDWPKFGTRLSYEEYLAAHARQHRAWDEVVPEYLDRSVLALVPLGHGYPEEWERWRDVFPPEVVRGHPYCDMVHKTRKCVAISSAGELVRDERGVYRLLDGSGSLTYPAAARPVRLLLRYEGAVGDVELSVEGEKLAEAPVVSPDGLTETSVILAPGARVRLGTTRGPVKLREVRLEEVK